MTLTANMCSQYLGPVGMVIGWWIYVIIIIIMNYLLNILYICRIFFIPNYLAMFYSLCLFVSINMYPVYV